MEIIRPELFKECKKCPRVDERVKYEDKFPDTLVFQDDFKAERMEVNCWPDEEGPQTEVYMEVWFEGNFTLKGEQRKQRREGRLIKVHLCPHFGYQGV